MIRRATAFVVFSLIACNRAETPAAKPPVEKPAPVAPAPVVTDSSQYALREGPFGPETTIVTTFTAPADKPVYLVNCNDAISVGLQRQEGNEWVHAWSAEMNLCLSAPIVIAPGKTRTETIVAASGVHAAVSSRRNESRIERGTYRATWQGVYTSFDPHARPWGEELPLEQRVSAPFFIEAAPALDPSRTSPEVRPAEIAAVEPEHLAQVASRTPIRVRFAASPVGTPYLYVDRDPVEHVQRSEGVIEYVPPRRWSPGRHEVRVIYQDQQRKTLWYAWSFMVAGD